MPCRVDICPKCNEYDCGGFSGGECRYPNGKQKSAQVEEYKYKPSPKPPAKLFDTSGALCDVLSLLEDKSPELLKSVDKKTLKWWKAHEKKELEKIKQEALNKLSEREKRILGLK